MKCNGAKGILIVDGNMKGYTIVTLEDSLAVSSPEKTSQKPKMKDILQVTN